MKLNSKAWIALSMLGILGIVFFTISKHKDSKQDNTFSQKINSTPDSKEALLNQSKTNSIDGKSVSASGSTNGTSAKTTDGKESGTTSVASGSKSAALVEKGPQCFTAQFKIPESDLPQVVKLDAAQEINPKSICMRLNGNAVAFKKKDGAQNEFILSGFDHATNHVQLQYCLKKDTCSDPCKIKKDAFLASLGADDDSDKGDEAQSDEEKHLERELASFQELRTSKEQKIFTAQNIHDGCSKEEVNE